MLVRVIRPLLTAGLVSLLSTVAGAQVVPPPAQAQQAQQALLNNPAMIARLQQMVQSSGLTTDQIRDRLRAQGYPEALLDQYLPGGAQPDSTAVPGEDVFGAIRSLGIADSLSVDSLRTIARNRRRARAQVDSAFLDTLQRALKNDTTAAAVRALLRSHEMQRQQADSGFKVFGLEMFENQTGLFDANTAGVADANYRFGPGDRLNLFLTGDVEKFYPLTVRNEGFVVIPDVGQVDVAGKTRAQLEDLLYNRLGRVYSGVRRTGATTHFYIDLAQMGANQVYVNGDVNHPSSYRVSRAATVMTALYQAGGPTANGSMRNVQVRRNGQTVATLDVYDYALRGDASNDVRLENGDIIFVPPRGPQVRVAGAVLRPATYEVKGDQTVAEVVRIAGGFTERADRRRIQIERIVPPLERTTAGTDRREVDVPSDLFETAPVRAGDLIRVLEVAMRVANRVTVKGNVWTTGPVGFTPGMTLFDALRGAGGLKPDSYLGEVLIARLQPDSTRTMLRTPVIDTVGHPANNLPLADGDEISVFSMSDFRSNRYVLVGGAVRKPGRVPFREGMTLHDAVLLAGGLDEGALLTEAEIARLPENRAAGVTALTTQVPLDSTYLFDRSADGRYGGVPGIPAPTTKAPEVLLRPYDAVLIKRQPDWQLQQTVNLQGEVKYPGAYSLTTKTERLSDILTRAGGLTSAAYPGGVVFVRKRGEIGRIGIDLPAVLADPHFVDNLQLVDGDSVYIPKFTPVVVLRGAVNSQVGVSYVAGADIDFYIRSAGGPTAQGDRGHAYVTQPNGKVETAHRRFLFWNSQPRPQPGSTVNVPVKDPNDRRDWLQIATAATSLLGSLVAVAAIVKR